MDQRKKERKKSTFIWRKIHAQTFNKWLLFLINVYYFVFNGANKRKPAAF